MAFWIGGLPRMNLSLVKDLSIADIAIFPWTRTVWRQGVDLDDYPHVVRWRRMLINRPAFLAGVQVGASARADTKDMTENAWLISLAVPQMPARMVVFRRQIASCMLRSQPE